MSDLDATDLLIVGGGVIGLAVGWRARQAGLSVRLLERAAQTAARTSRVAAGMIAPVDATAAARPGLLELGLASAGSYGAWTAELEAETGLGTGLQACGSLLLARGAEQLADLEMDQALHEQVGRPARQLSAAEIHQLEPALAPGLTAGLEVPDDAAVDPRALGVALERAFTRAGGQLVTGTEVAAVSILHDRVHGVRLDTGESLAAEHVVVAAGPWSAEVAGIPAAAQVPLSPVKGQILTLTDPSGPGALRHVLRMPGGYLVPRGDGRYVLGASVERCGFSTTITAGVVHALLHAAAEVVPGIAEWELSELNAGLRPGTPDDLPAIGPSPLIDGLLWATGHHRHGILLTPLTADLIVGELTGAPRPELARVALPSRFVTSEPAVRMVARG